MSNEHVWENERDLRAHQYYMKKQREEFLEGLYKYRDQIGFQKHISLDLLIEYWEARK